MREHAESYAQAKDRVRELIHDWDSKNITVDWYAGTPGTEVAC
jgi:hypothetical protein